MSLSMSKTNGWILGPSTSGIGDNLAGGKYVGNIVKDWGIEDCETGMLRDWEAARLRGCEAGRLGDWETGRLGV